MASTAANLMMSAKAFAISCQELESAKDRIHDLAILMLGTTSIELSFKAWIKHCGGTERDLRRIGHSLIEGYAEAIRRGLIDKSGQVGRAVAVLEPINMRAMARFVPDEPGFTALTPDSLTTLCVAVARTIEAEIWPEQEA